jgi:hypothetical protein
MICRGIANMNARQLRIVEIALDPERVGIDKRQFGPAGREVITGSQLPTDDGAVDRAPEFNDIVRNNSEPSGVESANSRYTEADIADWPLLERCERQLWATTRPTSSTREGPLSGRSRRSNVRVTASASVRRWPSPACSDGRLGDPLRPHTGFPCFPCTSDGGRFCRDNGGWTSLIDIVRIT